MVSRNSSVKEKKKAARPYVSRGSPLQDSCRLSPQERASRSPVDRLLKIVLMGSEAITTKFIIPFQKFPCLLCALFKISVS